MVKLTGKNTLLMTDKNENPIDFITDVIQDFEGTNIFICKDILNDLSNICLTKGGLIDLVQPTDLKAFPYGVLKINIPAPKENKALGETVVFIENKGNNSIHDKYQVIKIIGKNIPWDNYLSKNSPSLTITKDENVYKKLINEKLEMEM